MDQTATLAAFAIAGLAVLSCAFAPFCPPAFRATCAVAGAFITAWSAWAMATGAWSRPDYWQLVPLVAPTGLIGATILTKLRHMRQLRGLLPPLPEIEEPPSTVVASYPPAVPLGELAPAHDPWKALYVSLAQQRAKWSDAMGGPTNAAPAAQPLFDADPRQRYLGRHRRVSRA